MERARWRELDMEERVIEANSGSRLPAINAGIRAAGYKRLRPWPVAIPNHAMLDRATANEGLTIQLHQQSTVTQRWSPVPEGTMAFTGQNRALDRNQWRAATMRTPPEMRELIVTEPYEWVRLPFDNEPNLRAQLTASWVGLHSPRFTFSIPDNNIWTPFDLTIEDRYHWIGDNGQIIDGMKYFGNIGDRSRVALYLRPRRWRWFARVVAHFWIVTGFETAPNDEIFLKVFYDRPPFFPIRHELPRTIGNALAFHPYEGTLDYDRGIERHFQLSRAFGELQEEIVQQQYYSLCTSYILAGVDPAAITIQRATPRQGEIVCGIGIRDQKTGVETRAWALQIVDLTSVYPQQTISTFWCDFWT